MLTDINKLGNQNIENMEKLIFVKRGYPKQSKTSKNPVIKLNLNGGRFALNDSAAKALNVGDKDGIMFGFNQNAGIAYVMKDDEYDAFKLSRKDKSCLRFTSKDLSNFFDNTFNLLDSGKSIFEFSVDLNPNERGMHRVYLV